MGIINRYITRRCVFCKLHGDDLKYIPDYGIYNEECCGDWVHIECLKAVSCEPEKYGHKKVDLALSLFERMEEDRERKKQRKISLQNKCEKLKSYCIGE